MGKFLKMVLVPMLLGMMLVSMSGCSDDDGDSTTNPPSVDPVAKPVAIAIEQQDVSAPIGASGQFVAYGFFDNGQTAEVTKYVSWSSTNTEVVKVDNTNTKGFAKAVGAGQATITASYGKIAGTTLVTVADVVLSDPEQPDQGSTLTSISLTFLNGSTSGEQPVGVVATLKPVAHFSDGRALDAAFWLAPNIDGDAVAWLGRDGKIKTVAVGSATITYAYGDVVSNPVYATVTDAELESLRISPKNLVVTVGDSVQFKATGTFTDSQEYDMTNAVTWESTEPTVVAVDENGLATALKAGTAEITAKYGDMSASTSIKTLEPLEVVDIAVYYDDERATEPIKCPVSNLKHFLQYKALYSDGTESDFLKLREEVTQKSSDSDIFTVTGPYPDPYKAYLTCKEVGSAKLTLTYVSTGKKYDKDVEVTESK